MTRLKYLFVVKRVFIEHNQNSFDKLIRKEKPKYYESLLKANSKTHNENIFLNFMFLKIDSVVYPI